MPVRIEIIPFLTLHDNHSLEFYELLHTMLTNFKEQIIECLI